MILDISGCVGGEGYGRRFLTGGRNRISTGKRRCMVMFDRAVSVTVAASMAFWALGTGLMVAGFWDLRFMGWGLWLCGIGATCTVRRMLCQSDARSRNAFELGRDYERDDASIHTLR